jgi:prolipoprotein diacylglyceryltransferase
VSSEQIAAIPGCAGCVPGRPLHPSFAYEIAFHLLAFGALLWLRDRVSVPGGLLTLYLGAYPVFRFAVEFTRDNEVVLAGLTRGQLFLLVVGPLVLAEWDEKGASTRHAAAGRPDPAVRQRLLPRLPPGGPGAPAGGGAPAVRSAGGA